MRVVRLTEIGRTKKSWKYFFVMALCHFLHVLVCALLLDDSRGCQCCSFLSLYSTMQTNRSNLIAITDTWSIFLIPPASHISFTHHSTSPYSFSFIKILIQQNPPSLAQSSSPPSSLHNLISPYTEISRQRKPQALFLCQRSITPGIYSWLDVSSLVNLLWGVRMWIRWDRLELRV